MISKIKLTSNLAKLMLCTVFVLTSNFSFSQENKETDNFKKTDEVLSKVVERALNVAEKTGEFVIEQVPLLLQEFYQWHICKAIFMALLWLSIFFLIQRLSKLLSFSDEKMIPEENKKYYFKKRDGRYYYSSFRDGDSEAYAFSIGIKVASYFTFIGVAVFLYDLVFILVAPKLYLIEYFIK